MQDKVAIITGAGRGLGKAFALRYAEEGARLLLPDIGLDRAEAAAAEIRAKGGEAHAVMTDIADPAATLVMAEEAEKRYGGVDILVNNAAIWYGLNVTPWDAWTMEDWQRIFAVNVTGTWLCCKAVAPLMSRAGKGKIINIASNVARVPASRLYLPYACSKGAVITMTYALARELGPSGINVNAVGPGFTASEASLAQTGSEKVFELATGEQAISRRAETKDIVGAVTFLASDEADFISGQIVYIDGGTVML